VPDAPTLLESLRAVGYSFETAIADLIDNSITAKASNVSIQWRAFNDASYVAVLDDGVGMTQEELRCAMRHGSRNPLSERSDQDLGRFGLGMKTASLSQAKRLTVVSLTDGCLTGRCWDLDIIKEQGDWVLLEFEEDELAILPHIGDLKALSQGALVIWEKLDRVEAGEPSLEKALSERMERTREHLSLVFHRYLAKEINQAGISIKINGASVEPIDPFLRSHPSRQELPTETIHVEGSAVHIAPYILPHLSKLKAADVVLAGGKDGLRRHQGFYVYRNRRLITWGTWFRLARQDELTKLARVQVDIPNTLDHLWTLDIKKSVAAPPDAVRDALKRIVGRIAEKGKKVFTFRGRSSDKSKIVHLWDRLTGRNDEITYVINREHHLLKALRMTIPEQQLMLLERYLQAVEQAMPKDTLYADLASERKVVEVLRDREFENYLVDLANRWLDTVGRDTEEALSLLNNLPNMEPFNRNPVLAEKIVQEIRNG